jgi:AraC-like DNA-binding protein
VNSFIRTFKRSSGLTPGEYRKRYDQKHSTNTGTYDHE